MLKVYLGVFDIVVMSVAMVDNSQNFYKQNCTLFIGTKPLNVT